MTTAFGAMAERLKLGGKRTRDGSVSVIANVTADPSLHAAKRVDD